MLHPNTAMKRIRAGPLAVANKRRCPYADADSEASSSSRTVSPDSARTASPRSDAESTDSDSAGSDSAGAGAAADAALRADYAALLRAKTAVAVAESADAQLRQTMARHRRAHAGARMHAALNSEFDAYHAGAARAASEHKRIAGENAQLAGENARLVRDNAQLAGENARCKAAAAKIRNELAMAKQGMRGSIDVLLESVVNIRQRLDK